MRKLLFLVVFGFIAVGYLSSCSDDDVVIGFTGEEEMYALFDEDYNTLGTATIREREDGSIAVILMLNDVPQGESYPAHIHANTVSEGGDIIISLEPVNGDDDASQTIITQTDNGDDLSYQELIAYDAYIDVHPGTDNMETLIAAGDIGMNKLTGEAEFYKLYPISNDENSSDSTIVSMKERMNGETLVEMTFYGETDVSHPAGIYGGTAVMGGPLEISLNNIGSDGRSVTNVSEASNGESITYHELIEYDGHINVYQSEINSDNLLSQGDIGANEFTGRTSSYVLESVGVSTISGGVTFYERQDETFLTILEMNAPENSSYPAAIYSNSAEEGGNPVITLNEVDNGLSLNEIDAFDDGTPITYDDLLQYNGHIRVNDNNTGVALAQGNIGANAEN